MKTFLILMFLSSSCTASNYDKVEDACRKLYVDCDLVHSIVKSESNYRNVSRLDSNKKFSYGMMQIQCDTAKMIAKVPDCKKLGNSISYALFFSISYLKRQLKRYQGSVEKAVASYNSGSAFVCKNINRDKRGRILCYPGEFINYNYVNPIMRRYTYLKRSNQKGAF